MAETFTAVLSRGTGKDTLGIVVPDAVVDRLGQGRRPPVQITIGGHAWRSTVARMGDSFMVGVPKEHRGAAGLTGDEDHVEVTLTLDTAPRTVEVPDDLAAALAAESLAEAFTRLAPSTQKELVRQITTAKAAATRDKRVGLAVDAARARR